MRAYAASCFLIILVTFVAVGASGALSEGIGRLSAAVSLASGSNSR